LAVTRVAVLPELNPATYRRHSLHADERVWVEKNCYIDIWLEVIHALGLEPMAILPFVVALDFEGDQWTFFKPPHDELRTLYGIDVQELNVWRPLIAHAEEYVSAGKMISTEADAFWLPDTAGTDYRRQHTKTTIVIQDLDVAARRLGYFHNAAYYALDGEDFVELFRLDAAPDPTFMPLFAEFIRIDGRVRRPSSDLLTLSGELLRRHLARRPVTNPIARFRARLVQDLPSMQDNGLAFYHAWAFATIRQLGAAFELLALHLEWRGDGGEMGLRPAIDAFHRISSGCKTLILKAARAISLRRPLDVNTLFPELETAWNTGIATLEARCVASAP
jgi:hypothetical protein